MNGHIEGRDQRRGIDQARLFVGPVPQICQEQGGEGERRQEEPEEPGEILGQLHVRPLVEEVADQDAETVGAQVLVGGKVGVTKLLLDRATGAHFEG